MLCPALFLVRAVCLLGQSLKTLHSLQTPLLSFALQAGVVPWPLRDHLSVSVSQMMEQWSFTFAVLRSALCNITLCICSSTGVDLLLALCSEWLPTGSADRCASWYHALLWALRLDHLPVVVVVCLIPMCCCHVCKQSSATLLALQSRTSCSHRCQLLSCADKLHTDCQFHNGLPRGDVFLKPCG